MANKVQELQQEILKLTKEIQENGKATKQQANELKKLEKQYERLGSKLMPQYRNAHKQVNDALKNSKKLTDAATKSNKSFVSRLTTAVGTLFRYSLAYKAINAANTIFNELTIESAKRAIRLEKALADVGAIANLTSTEINKLKDTVFEVAGSTSLTATEVVELQKQLAKLGTSVEDIQNLTEPIALLSQALGEEPGGVAAALKKTLNQFQATTEESSKFANILVGAVNETALSLNDLGTALQYVGPLAAQSGVSFEDTSSLLGILADNGFRASRAGTGLRNVLLESAKSGKPFAEFLEDLAKRNLDVAEATEIFGKRGASAAIVLANNVERFSELSDELTRSNRLFLANAKQMATTQGQLDLLASAYDKFSTSLGETITQTNLFINLIAILDKRASGLAGAYRIVAQQSEQTKLVTDELVESFRQFTEGTDNPITQSEALGRAIELIGKEGDFSKSTIDETYSLLMFYLKQGKTLQEAFAIATEKTGRGQLRLLTTTQEFVNLLYEQSKGLDSAFISQQANNDVVKRYKEEYSGLLSLTKEGVEVDKEKERLQKQINIDIVRYSNELAGLRSNQVPTQEELERVKILEKRIALLTEESEKIGQLSVSEETLAEQRKKSDKEAEQEFKSRLKEYLDRIKETEQVIEDLRVEVGEDAFPQQIDLLNGFFGSAEDIIKEAEKRFGPNSDIVKGLIKTFKDTADEISVTLPKEAGEKVELAIKGVFGDGVDLTPDLPELQKPVEVITESFEDKLRKAFAGLDWGDVILDAVSTATGALEDFNDVALENTTNRLEQEISAIENRYSIEEDILKSQLDNQIITESQFRKKQVDLRKAQIAEENNIERQIFDAEKKRDRQNASTDYLEAIASIIPTLIAYDKTADPVSILTKAAITGALATAAYGAEISAIGQRKFYPKKFAEGGIVNGPSHSDGGVPFSVQGQGGYEMEGGEYIINKRATAMHRDLLDRINNSYRTKPIQGSYKFAQGGFVNSPINESVDYLKAIAEATTSTAIGVSKPVRAYVSDKDLRSNATERRIRDRNDRL